MIKIKWMKLLYEWSYVLFGGCAIWRSISWAEVGGRTFASTGWFNHWWVANFYTVCGAEMAVLYCVVPLYIKLFVFIVVMLLFQFWYELLNTAHLVALFIWSCMSLDWHCLCYDCIVVMTALFSDAILWSKVLWSLLSLDTDCIRFSCPTQIFRPKTPLVGNITSS